MTTMADTGSVREESVVMQESVTINCKKCGGIANPVAGQEYHRCRFCDSLIQLAEVSVDRILPTGAFLGSEGTCPCCADLLQTGVIEGRRGLYCGLCFGMLLRHEDFGGIIQERQARRAGIEPAEPRPVDPKAFHRRLNCPSCHAQMDVHPYYGPGNIVIDTCAQCGLMWLDHGELTRVEQSAARRFSLADTSSAWPASAPGGHSSSTDLPDADPTKDSPLRILAELLF
jgi:Zn-finger nucleic acid-binding protein